jgi:hypothetical protein
MKKLLARAGLAVGSLLLTLASVELLFRAIDPPAPAPACLRRDGVARDEHCVFNDYDPLLGFDGKKSFRGAWGVAAAHNALGFRGEEIDPANRRGDRRVLFLGDSQTWGFGLRDDETLPVAVERLLDRDGSGRRWQAVNLGVSGYGPDQSFLRYLIAGRALDAEVVVFVLFPNDLSEVTATTAWNVAKPRFSFAADGGLCLGNVPPERIPGWEGNQILPADPFWSRFASLRFLMNREWPVRLLAWIDRPDVDAIADAVPCVSADPGRAEDPIELTSAILVRLGEVLASEGRRFVVVFVPIRFRLESVQSRPYYREIDRRLRRHGIATVELRRALWGYAQAHPGEPVFDDSGHLRANAIRDVVAPAVAAAIRRRSPSAAPRPSAGAEGPSPSAALDQPLSEGEAPSDEPSDDSSRNAGS